MMRGHGTRYLRLQDCRTIPSTKFFQNYYLPTKFGYDKRRPHLSSLIVSGQMTREDAIEKLKEPLYDPQELERDIEYFCNKIRISRREFDEIMATPPCDYSEYASWDRYYRLLKRTQSVVEKSVRRPVKAYS